MKRIVSMIGALVFFVSAFAQDSTISITTNKTSTLVFPAEIIHVDRGSKNILAQEIAEAKNILLIKAGTKFFDATNLTVVIDDGSNYTFTIVYSDTPSAYVYKLPLHTVASVSTYANDILDNPYVMHHIGCVNWEVAIQVTGVYIKSNTIFYQIMINNKSPIDYDIDFIRFYIRDKKIARRTAVQEIELKPLYIAGNYTTVKANEKTTLVVALEKFIIPDAKYLAVEIMEKNGGRNLQMKVSNRQIMKAITLPDLH